MRLLSIIFGAVSIGLIFMPYDLPWQVLIGAGGLWATFVGLMYDTRK